MGGQTPSNQIANVLLRIIFILCSEGSLFHFRPIWCPTTLNLPYSEHEIKIEGFGGRPLLVGGLGPWAPCPPKSGPALTSVPGCVAGQFIGS